MGLFWSYFRDTLRLPYILKRGALAMLAEGGSTGLDGVRGIIVTLRDQFLAERCEEAVLANFARSRGIIRAPLEPEASWRGRVRFAYLWWQRGGRAGGMEQVLIDYFGFAAVDVANMRAEDPARWAEFTVTCSMIGEEAPFTPEQVTWLINEMKPARSKLAGLTFEATVLSDIPCWSGALWSAETIMVWPDESQTVPHFELIDETTGAVIIDETTLAELTT